MIWLKENDSFLGYVPILRKEYSEQDIRKMSDYSCYQGWSELSSLVMQIQGIGFAYYGDFSEHYKIETQRLVDIRFNFEFECFLLPSDPRMEIYRRQIFEVFENLTLYKVEEYSKEEMEEKIRQAKYTLEQLISAKTLSAIDYDISDLIRYAEISCANLSNLQKMFVDNGYVLTHGLFSNINKTLSKKIYRKRRIKTILEMTSY